MRTSYRSLVVATSLLASTFVAEPRIAIAQQSPVSQAGKPATDPTGKKALPLADYARWRAIQTPAISSDGIWAAWTYTQLRRDDQLRVKEIDGTREFVVERGSRAVFSDDGRWVAYAVAPPRPAAGAAGGRGGRGGAPATAPVIPPSPGTPATPAGAPGGAPAPSRAELLNLQTGATVGWDGIATFQFAKGSAFFVAQRARPEPRPRFDGTDLILRDLKSGADRLIGSVGEYAFNKSGTVLAWTVDAADEIGNGLYLSDLASSVDRVLENARERYQRLTWSDDGNAVAALHGLDVDTLAQRPNTLVAFTAIAGGMTPRRVSIASGTAGVPANVVISDKGAITWSETGDRVVFSLKSQDVKPRPKTDDAIVAPSDVDIFHVGDDRIQSVQRAQANADRNRTDRAVLDLATQKVVRLSDSTHRTVTVTRDARWAVVSDDRKYVSDWQEPRADYYRVDATTGERAPMMTAAGARALGMSPNSRYYLYWKDKQVWSYDLAANKTTAITAKAPVSFVNAEDDHMAEKPPYGVTGFTKDGNSVILDHRFDLWLASLDGSGTPRNLTNGVGSKSEIRFRYERTEPADAAPAPGGGGGGGRGGGAGAADRGIDLAKPMLLSAYGDKTKKSGYYELKDGQLRELVYQDKAFGARINAERANRVLFTREDWSEFPDLQVADLNFQNAKKVSDANPQQAEYRWGRRILFDFKDRDGHKLQGTLAIPDGYTPGTRLPMLVNFYEKNSQNLHRYQTPRYPASTPSFSAFVSNGYLVMQPDVYFHGRTSHQDMLESVESAVKRVVELGYADAAHVGLQGHSYSGGGSAYIAGHSKIFAAVNSGAAPIDLATEFNTLFRGSGQNNQNYDIRGQGRYGTDPYKDPDLYYKQSPISGVMTMNTPLLQMQGDADPTVEYLQGVEWYNALRFNNKPVIFLSYPGEGHGLGKLENQIDYGMRQIQFFDHYLKGAPAPKWMTDGERFVDKDKRQPVQITVEKKAAPPVRGGATVPK